jgi:hypothetical protein
VNDCEAFDMFQGASSEEDLFAAGQNCCASSLHTTMIIPKSIHGLNIRKAFFHLSRSMILIL